MEFIIKIFELNNLNNKNKKIKSKILVFTKIIKVNF